MAIFSKTTEKKEQEEVKTEQSAPKVVGGKHILLIPRLSEKANSLAPLNKYVFKVPISANKISVKKSLEKIYGVKIASINMVRMKGKVRRYRETRAKLSDFKKAIVTLKKDSKKFDIIENA